MNERQLKFLFFVLCAAFIANLLGYAFIVPILPSWKTQFALNNTQATALVSLWAVPLFLLGPMTGRVVDRFGAMPIIFISLVLLTITSLLYLVAVQEKYGSGFYLLAIARLLHGLAGASIMTAGFSLASELWPLKFGETSGQLIGIAVIGGLLGPVIGGITFAYSPTLAFLTLAAVPALVSPLAFISMRTVKHHQSKAGPTSTISIMAFIKEPMLFRIGMLVVLATLATGALEAGVPLLLQEALGLGSASIGLILLGLILFQGLGGWFWGVKVDQKGPIRYMIWGWILVSISLLVCGFVIWFVTGNQSVWIVVGVLAIFQFAIAATQVPMLPMIDTATNQLFGTGSAGLAFGAFGTAWAAGTILGPLAIGPMLDLTNSWALTVSALTIPMAIGLWITIANKEMLTTCYQDEMNARLGDE